MPKRACDDSVVNRYGGVASDTIGPENRRPVDPLLDRALLGADGFAVALVK